MLYKMLQILYVLTYLTILGLLIGIVFKETREYCYDHVSLVTEHKIFNLTYATDVHVDTRSCSFKKEME